MTNHYDELLDTLCQQDKETVEAELETTTSDTAIRKALKLRLKALNSRLELLDMPIKYSYISISRPYTRNLISYVKISIHKNKPAKLPSKFEFKILGDSDE